MVRTLSRMDEHPLRRLWSHADNHRGDVVVASLWSFLNKVFDLAPPLLIGLAVDVVVERDDSFLAGMGIENLRTQLYVLAGLSAVIWILESVFEYLLGVKWRNLAQTIQHELRLDAYNHVQDLELAYFEDESTGGLLSVLNDDVNQLERFLDGGANSLIQLVTTITLIGGGMMIAVPGVAWIAFLPIPVIIIGSVKFQSALEPRYAAMRDQVSILNATTKGRKVVFALHVRHCLVHRLEVDVKRLMPHRVPVQRIGCTSGEYPVAVGTHRRREPGVEVIGNNNHVGGGYLTAEHGVHRPLNAVGVDRPLRTEADHLLPGVDSCVRPPSAHAVDRMTEDRAQGIFHFILDGADVEVLGVSTEVRSVI